MVDSSKGLQDWDPIEHLKRLSARELLGILNKKLWRVDNNPDRYVTAAQVKQALRAREHVPNKTEAKVLRQERARKKNRPCSD